MIKSLFIILSVLPRIDLSYTTLATDTFSTGTFLFSNQGDTIGLNMAVRHRGASSRMYDKPSYAIKLYDSLWASVDTSFLGMRQDNYWILDAMASDKARMRNRVSLDLWLEISRQPWYHSEEPACINGYRGHMVEVYLNGVPQGVYHFMERIDRKQLKLKKYSAKNGIRGTLYKSISWANTANFYPPTIRPSDLSSAWDSWEIKYPDLEDSEPITWSPLYNLFTFVNQADSTTFADSISYYLDIPVYIDYAIFCQLLSARDNTAKNVYLSLYNQVTPRFLYSPWDFDHSWGRQFDGSEEDTNHLLAIGKNLFTRMNKDYPSFTEMQNMRWQELRDSYFTLEHIDSLFAHYFDLYERTGIDTLEQRIWSKHNGIELNIASERNYIHNWVETRLIFLDRVYNYTPTNLNISIDNHTKNTPITFLYNQRLVIKYGDILYDIYGRPVQIP